MAGSRGRLKSMRVSESFRDFALDQLSGLDVRAQAMFGGIGLYTGDVFFGILAADELYFKVDETTRGGYEAVGGRLFKPYADRPMTMPYASVPAGVIEDAETLKSWARRSIAIATATRKAKPPKKRPAARKSTGRAAARK